MQRKFNKRRYNQVLGMMDDDSESEETETKTRAPSVSKWLMKNVIDTVHIVANNNVN